MRLKTFRAPDLESALARARQQLGPRALVLATSEIRGRLGLSSVEITVAVDEPSPAAPDRGLERLALEVPRLRRQGGGDTARAGDDASPTPAGRAAAPGLADAGDLLDDLDPALRTAADTLIRAGLSPDLARRFARSAARGLEAGATATGLAAAVERAMGSLVPLAPAPTGGRIVFVVGPPGAGKTTTVAKLAACVRRRSSRPVVFAEADASRPGAQEQAGALARLLGLPLALIRRGDELRQAMERVGQDGAVLVDTSGVGAADDARLGHLADLRGAAPEAQVALLLPAGLHREEAEEIVERFRPLRPTCVAFSRTDDGGRIGELVTAITAAGLPLAFVTNGHRVPDIEEISPRGLTALLLRSGFRSSARRGARA
jgi:flagellar biosynthesis protein FlhF